MLSSLRRVLRPDAALIAVTNAAAYTAELDEIFAEATTALFGEERPRPRLPANGFTLDEAASHLSRHFASVTIHVRRVPLKVPTPEPVVAYLASLRSYIDEALASTARLFDELAPYIEAAALRRITATGAVEVTGLPAAIVCRWPSGIPNQRGRWISRRRRPPAGGRPMHPLTSTRQAVDARGAPHEVAGRASSFAQR